MRALWTGAINFGLINIPVKLYSATKESSLNLDYLHKHDHEPIRYARVCKKDGKEVPFDDIVRGYEFERGDYVILEDEDFKRANAKKTQTIDMVSFTVADEIDAVYYEKPYFLEPAKGAEKSYTLLRNALVKAGKVGIATFVLRNREHLAVIRPFGKGLILEQLRFQEEIRDTKDLKLPDSRVTAQETEMALALIEHLTEPFKPQDFRDTYTQELKEVIADKAKGRKPKKTEAVKMEPTDVKDLMKLLRASLQKDRPTSFAVSKAKGRKRAASAIGVS